MLVISRRTDESVKIGDDVTVTIVSVKGGKVRLGISAPPHVPVSRSDGPVPRTYDPAAPPRHPDDCVCGKCVYAREGLANPPDVLRAPLGRIDQSVHHEPPGDDREEG